MTTEHQNREPVPGAHGGPVIKRGKWLPLAAAGILVIVIFSLVGLLFASADNDFLPGVVEIATLVVIGVVLGIGAVVGFGPGGRFFTWLANPEPGQLVVSAIGASVLATTAALAVVFEDFPWPAALLGGALITIAAHSVERTRRLRRAPIEQIANLTDDRREALEYLSETDLFHRLGSDTALRLLERGETTRVLSGAPLGVEGLVSSAFFVVVTGRAELTRSVANQQLTVRVISRGDAFPLSSLIGDGSSITGARAATDMLVWRISRAALIDFCDSNPRAGALVYESAAVLFAERYRRSLWQLAGRIDGPGNAEPHPVNL